MLFVVACFIVGFSRWLAWTKFHIVNGQSVMVILDIVFFFILVPINGLIIIVQTIFGLIF